MAQLDVKSVRYSPVLTTISVAFYNEMYAADHFFPTLPSKGDTGIYFKYGREAFQINRAERQLSTKANQVTHNYTRDSYVTQEFALREELDDKVINNAVDPLRPKMDATENVTEQLKLQKEYAAMNFIQDYSTTFASYCQTLATYNASSNPIYSFLDDFTNTDPCYMIGLIVSAIRKNCGRTPNVISFNPVTENLIACNPKTKDRFRYVQALNSNTVPYDQSLDGKPTGKFLDLKVVRSSAIRDTQNPGQTTVTSSYLLGNVIFIGFVEPNPGIKKTMLGATFEHKPLMVYEHYDEDIFSTVIQVKWDYVIKVIAPQTGYVIYNVLSS